VGRNQAPSFGWSEDQAHCITPRQNILPVNLLDHIVHPQAAGVRRPAAVDLADDEDLLARRLEVT
jgi:hypothetical protein